MRIFKSKWFVRFAQKNEISDEFIKVGVEQIKMEIIDADLGDNVFKQRLPRQGQGKSGGFRTIILLRQGQNAFLYTVFLNIEKPISIKMKRKHLKKWPNMS